MKKTQSQTALRAASGEIKSTLQQAITQHEAGELVAAEVLYRRVLEDQPDHLEALYRLAALVREGGRTAEYIDLMQAALSLTDGDKLSWLNLGNAYLELGRAANAATCYQQALSRNPAFAEAYHNLGLVCQNQARHDDALACFRQALSLQPDYVAAHLNMAAVLHSLKRHADAADCYRKVLALQPLSAETHYNLGRVLQDTRLFGQALDSYRQALALQPGHFAARSHLGATLHALERYDEAIAVYQALLANAPHEYTASDYSEVYNNLGAVLKNQGKLDEAITCYQQALALQPDYAKALFNLGTIHFIRKDYPEAVQWYQASLALEPHQVEAHQNMAAIMLAQGHPDIAQQHRDLAYRKQALFIDTAANPVHTVLVLWAAGTGNIPIDFLLPVQAYTRLVWMMEYATEEQERTLPPYDLVFNAIGDEDAAGPTKPAVARFLARCDKPVLNLPAAVAKTSRDGIPALLAAIPNVLVPLTARFETAVFKEQVLQQPGLRLPLLVRPSGSHGGDHLLKLDSVEELAALVPFNASLYYASNYHDYASADGYFRKYRIVFVDRRPYPYHLAISPHWMVHYETAEMLDAPWKQEEEARFLADPARAIGAAAMAAVTAIGRALDLDYCGLDFSLLPDGLVLVFEANATMLVHPEDDNSVLRYKNPSVQDIFQAFNALVAQLASGNVL